MLIKKFHTIITETYVYLILQLTSRRKLNIYNTVHRLLKFMSFEIGANGLDIHKTRMVDIAGFTRLEKLFPSIIINTYLFLRD